MVYQKNAHCAAVFKISAKRLGGGLSKHTPLPGTARVNTLNLRATNQHDTLNQKIAPVTPPYVPEVISGHEAYPIAF